MKILEKEKRVIKKSTLIKTILLCLVLIAMIVCFSIAKKVKREKQIVLANGDMELLRAMSYEELNNSDELTNSDYVRFSAFFLRDTDLDGYANRIKGTAKEIGTSDTLYMSLAVLAEGTFKDGSIEIIGENFYFQTALIDDEVIDGNYIDANTSLINLKDVRVGTQKLFFGNVRSGNYSNGQTTAAIGNDTSKYSKVNKVILRGIHVKDDGTETYVVKEVEFPVDWYSTVKTEIPFIYEGDNENKYQHYGIGNLVDEKNQIVKTTFKVVAQEINNKLLLSKSYIEAEIPLLNNYEPLTVEVKGTNIGFEYDPATRIVKAYRDATVNGDLVTSQAYAKQYHNTRYNEYEITVTYPIEAYQNLGVNVINLVVPVRAYYEGFNNPNEEFGSPIRSNLAEDVINITYEYGGGDVVSFNVQVGKYVQNPYNSWVVSKAKPDRAYNNHMQEDFEYEVDRYDVLWEIGRGKEGTVSNIIARETDKNPTDQIITTDNRYIDIDDFVKNVGLYLYVPGLMLGENGYVDVFNDETNELIHRFTSADWDLYTKENPYMYETPIAHVRIETGAAANNSYFAINHIKEIDNEYIINNIPEEEFEKYRLISSHLAGYVKFSESDETFTHSKDDVERANYDLQKSVVSFGGISPAYFTTQEVKENVKLTIKTQELVYNTISWVNGEFLVKLPKEILTLDINSVTVSNPGVKVLGYSLDEKEDGWYLKILTENPNIAYTYDIVIDCNITPDPRIISSEQIVTIYAINEIATSYLNETKDIYDVDSDGNTDEYIGVATGKINFIGPTSLITMEAATEYNSNHDRLETTIAPQIAIIDKAQSEKTAVIQASILNNYSNTISEIRLVGKIPFEGNTFQLVEKDLGSMYTTKLLGPITVPEALRDYAKVYYSENEIVNEDLNDSTNNWISEDDVTDYSKYKSYLIDLGSYTMTKGEKQICEYKIEIPNTVNYNEVAYSTHAVFFSLDTPEGKLRDRTETNKLGFMIARKYNLEINKTKQGSETYIKGATFSVIEEGESNKSKIVTTNISGQISILDLYVDKVYTIKEIKSPYDYVLNPQEIKVKATVNEETGELEVTKLSGETKDEVTVQDREHGKTVVVNIENEPKYTLKLTKTVEGTEEVIKGVRFRIYGKGLATAGRTATTNKDGLITVTGLYPREKYTIVEEYAKGYEYSTVLVEFRAVWDGNVLVPEIISGSFNKETVIDNNQIGQPIMTTGVTNIKLREYSFGLTKYEKDTTKKLANATFRITGKWLDEEIVTDENGYLEIPILYEGIEYTLEEILAPEGYAVNENKVKFIGTFDEDGKLNIQVTGGTLITSREIIAKKEAKEQEKNNSTEGDQNVENKVENTVTEDNIENTIENKVENIVEPDPEIPISLSDEEETVETTYGTVVDSTGTEVSKVEVKIEQKDNGNLVFNLGYEDEPLFKLTKYDGTTMESLPNVKFAIKKINDDGTESDAIDTNGNLIGEEEKINDVKYRVIKTDSKGEITADLPEGLYKVIEVETLAAYVLPEDIAQRTYTFGIGKSKPAVKEVTEMWNNTYDSYGKITYTDTVMLEDGFFEIGYFTGTVKIPAESVANGEELLITAVGSFSDGILIKRNVLGEVEWYKTYKNNHTEVFNKIEKLSTGNYIVTGYRGNAGTKEQLHVIYDINGNVILDNELIAIASMDGEIKLLATNDGGYIAIEKINKDKIIPAKTTLIGEDIVISNKGNTDSLIIKYNSDEKVEWVTSIADTNRDGINGIVKNSNGDYIIVGDYMDALTIPAEDTVDGIDIGLPSYASYTNNAFIMKVNSSGKIVWAKYAGTSNYDAYEDIFITEDGNYIVTGYLGNSIVTYAAEETVDGIAITAKGQCVVTEYNDDGKVKWSKGYNSGSNANFKKGFLDKDNNILYAGVVSKAINVVASETVDNKEIVTKFKGSKDIVLTKLIDTKVKWMKTFGSVGEDSVIDFSLLDDGRYLLKVNLAGKTVLSSNDTIFEDDIIISGCVILIVNEDGIIEEIKCETNSSQEFRDVAISNEQGYVVVGDFSGEFRIPAEETLNMEQVNVYSNASNDGIIIKYTDDGLVEWVNTFGNINADIFRSIINVEDGYITVGTLKGEITIPAEDTVNGEQIYLKASGTNNGLIVKFSNDGLIEWAKIVNNTGTLTFTEIENTLDGGYVILGDLSGNLKYSQEETVDGIEKNITSTNTDVVVVKYNENNTLEWAKSITGTGNEASESIEVLNNGEIVIAAYTSGSTLSVAADNTVVGNEISKVVNESRAVWIARFDENGYINFLDAHDYYFTGMRAELQKDLNDGYILLGRTWAGGTYVISADKTENNQEIPIVGATGLYKMYMMKYNDNNKIEWATNFQGHINPEATGYIGTETTADGGYIIADRTYFTIFNKKGEFEYRVTHTNVCEAIARNENEFVFAGKYNETTSIGQVKKFSSKIVSAEIPTQQLIEVPNYKKELNITTEVKVHDDGTKGGTISGEGESPYEVVVYGENATKEIIITPDENYKILTLTINDVAYPYTIEDDGTVRINLENVTENKHIVVEFSNTISEVLVHHYIDGTENKVADDQSIVGVVGANYTTAPAMDLEDYEVIVEKIPENASGVFTADVQEVIYYYQEKKVMVTVNHYLEGTTDKLSESTISEYLKGEEYSTTKADDINVKYELVAVPSNSTGTVTDNLTVNYYYRVKKYNITTNVEGTGGDITGSGNITLEEVEHGDDSTTEIVITPEEGFYVENVTINGKPVDFITGIDNVVTLDKFIGMEEDKEIVVTFARTEGQVIVHHYIEGTTDKVPSNVEGEVVEDEIKIGYVGDSFATMESANIAEYYELSSKSEETSGVYTEATQEIYYYYKLKQYNYTVEYYYDGELDSSKVDVITATWGDVISTYTDKNITGYTLEKEENLPLTITQDESTNVIKVYYVKDKFNYTVEYYFEGEIDSAKTDVIEATYLDEIKTYTDKVEVGYKLDRVETLPMVVTEVEENNIIKVFYVIDENQTKEKVYTVEYYKDGVKVEADTQVTTETVQVLEPDTMTVNKDLINTTNKYFGYKLDDVNTIIPDTVTSGDVIKVYYVTDESHTKTLFYTVEYYKDNVFADRDIKQETVQVLQPDILNVDKDAINLVDKYVGYKFEKVEPENIPDTISNGGVIKVYYVRDTFGYSVEYYFDGVIDSNLTENYTALYNDEITSYTDKVKVGYKLHVVETIPMKVTENSANNVIRVYYVIDENQTKDLNYTVEYYKDGVLVSGDTQIESETVQILDDDVLSVDKSKINLVDKYYGYKLDTENTMIPDSVITGAVIKVYYVTDDGNTKNLSYTVEYYKDNVLIQTDTDIVTTTVQVLQPDTLNVDKAAINMVDKYVGYKFEKVEPENIPDTISNGGVIKVYYVRDTFEYRMEYYFNGVIDDTLTDTYTALYNEKINDHVDKVKVGYTLERVDPLPLTVTEIAANNVMRIYYVTDELQTKDLSYTVEYYKGNMLVSEDTEVETETVQVLEDNILDVDKSKINVTNKYVGYKLDTENTIVPDSVTTGEIIKVYYVRDTFAYSMEYYFNGIKDDSLTDTYTALYNEKINDHIDKVKVGYTLDKVEPLLLTVTENAVNNVMRIYYITDELQTKDLSYTVEYYKDGVKEDSDTQIETITVQVLEPDTMAVDKTKINLVDKYFGYKLDSITVVPDIVNSGDVIKVYYVVDENQTKELSYTVEYYKDGVLVSGDTQTESEIVQVLEDDKMVVRTANINMTNKYVGYKFEKTEPTVISDEVDTGAVIKVYYVRDTFDYSVEYYFNGVIDTSLTDTMSALFGDVIDTYEDKVKTGYRLNKVETLPMTVTENSLNNVIRVYYVTDDAQTKDLKYTVEYYKDGIKVNSDTQIETETVQLLEDDKLTVRKENINTTNKYVGYKFERTDPTVIPDEVDTGSVIKVYYIKDNFDYTIEYYYDGIKDDSKTEVGSALFESTIDTYTDKVIDGYVFEKVEGKPITIDFDITKNVMKVYYTKRTDLSYTVKYLEEGTNNVLAQEKVVNNQTFKDIVTENAIDIEGYNKVQSTKSIEITTGTNEIILYYTKRNDLSYRVEYYFDNVIDNNATEIVNNQVYGTVIDTYQDKVKVGYKLDSDTAPITIGVGENVIKVYYVTDEAQTKELSYTVEYYKDGVRVDSDTQIEVETVQILEDNIMNVNLSKINVVNKYVGYKLSALDPASLPSQVENGAVIKVYYVRDSYNYTVEYYYNNIIDSSATERINAKYADLINTYEDKVKPGYKLDRAEVPFTVTEVEENNVIRVYYVTDDAQIKELSYTVEYYKDGVLTDTEVEKETVQLLEDDKLAVRKDDINMTNKYVGYKFEKVEPENIPDEVDTGSVIKVYYVRDTFGYTIEYYYNNVIDDTLTENKTALYGDKIETFTNNVKDGYIQGKVENIPLIITEDESQNIMRVFYEIDPTQVKELSYTVEYYKDGVKVETDTQVVSKTVQLLDDNIIEVNISNINTTDKYVGYKLDNTEPNVIPTEVVTGSVIKVYYVKDNFDYTVEYYYENVIEPSKTDVISATYQDVIDTYTDKVITGYEFDKVEGTPLTITENESTNVIKVYYKKARFEYKVEYYYDGELKENYTETKEAVFEDRIETYTPKEDYGYKFDKTFNLPMRVSENIENNVIEVYYVRKDSTVSVQFVDKVSGNTISPEVVKEGKVFDTFDITNDVKEIEGYTLIESPSTLTGTFEEEAQTFTYYYAKTSNVVVKYLEEDTNVELLPEENIVGYESKEYSTTRKDVANYTFVKDTENTTGVMTDRTITVIYYYAQNTKVTVNYIDKNTGAILDQVVVPGKVGDEYTSAAKDITYYVLVQSPVRETVTMTKDEIVLEYYYAHVSAGVIEKHIDIKSGELLDNKEYVGNEGDSYTTNSKTFDGYDLVVEMLPENASGTMTIDVIEVKYYYIRRTMVIVEYVDNLTGKVLKDYEGVDIDGDGLIDDIAEIDSTVVIEGHEGDNYTTEEKSFDGYDLVMEKYPANSKGTMGVVVDEDGKTTVVTNVTYYYALKTKVTVSYIDVISGEVIDTEEINGHEGDEYETERKEIDGYDIVIESIPENEKGIMTEEPIEVKYYYRAKATVTVNHIDNYTGKELLEIDSETKAEVDSSVIINGHEGDEYNTSSKSFKGYELREDKLPTNAKGYMSKGDIVVNYYYSYKSSVKVLYIEKATGKNITDSVLIEGYEGDGYKATIKDVSGYKLIEVPGEESGKITKDQKTIVYYYEKLSGGVKINYIDIHNNNILGGDTITGIVGDNFEANFKQFEGYELVIEKLPSNNKGTLQEGMIEINYYYRKIGTDTTTPVITPPTGDSIINGLIVVAYTVLVVNVITLIKKKKHAKK